MGGQTNQINATAKDLRDAPPVASIAYENFVSAKIVNLILDSSHRSTHLRGLLFCGWGMVKIWFIASFRGRRP